MIADEEFVKATLRFDELEKRGSFYDMAINLIDNNFEIEAHFIILATWNFAVFRYAVKDFNIDEFKEKISKLRPHFDKIENENFKTIAF